MWAQNWLLKIKNQCASDSRVFKELYASFEPFNLNSYTQKKIQEAVDTEKFSELLRNQSPNREKATLQSHLLPSVPALGFHLIPSGFQISIKYRLGIAVYEDERKCSYCRLGPLTFLVTTTSSVPEKGMQIRGMKGCVTVLHQLAQQLTCPQSSENGTLLQETVLALAQISAFMKIGSSSCSRRHRNFSTATKHYKSCGREVWLRD